MNPRMRRRFMTGAGAAVMGTMFATATREAHAVEINVATYGAGGDGSDQTAALNSAIAAANAASGPITLVFPPGRYKITGSGLNIISRGDISVLGHGAVIAIDSTTTQGLVFYNTTPLVNVEIVGLTLTSATRGGLGVKFLNCQHCKLDRVNILKQVVGLYLASFAYVFVDQCNFDECTTAVELYDGLGLMFVNGRVNGGYGTQFTPGTKGFKIVRGSGLAIAVTDITCCQYAVLLEPDSGGGVTWLFIDDVWFDTSEYGLHGTRGNALKLIGLQISNSYFSVAAADGIKLLQATGITIANCIIQKNVTWGAYFSGCQDVRVEGCTIVNNDVRNSGGGSPPCGGIYEEASTNVHIVGNSFINDNSSSPWAGNESTQRIGFKHAISGNNINVVNNDFVNHSIAEIDFTHVPLRASIRGNTTDRSNQVNSANDINPPLVHDVVHIVGSTLVANISSVQIPHRELTFITDGTCTIQHSWNWALNGGLNFDGTRGSVLTTITNPNTGKITEVSRSVPPPPP